MDSVLRKFVQRAPRYILRPQDRNVMRFSLENTLGTSGIEQTTLINLSESGLAFLAAPGTQIEIGERIKVEIPIPGREQIAWGARVVRIQDQETKSWRNKSDAFTENPSLLVALRFEPLPHEHTSEIRKGIEQSFLQAMREQRSKNLLYYKVLLNHRLFPILGYIALTLLAFYLLYWLAQPDENYDGKRGAPWGQRFKF